MRLFELDYGSLRSVLSVYQDNADEKGASIEIPFPALLNMAKKFGLPLGDQNGDTTAIVNLLKDKIDPTGDIVTTKDSDPSTLIIQPRKTQAAVASSGGSSSLDKMASNAAKKAINSKL